MERRLPFEVRLSEKDFSDVQVGPLRLNVRMDRVDEVEGGEVLIDYKTGRLAEGLADGEAGRAAASAVCDLSEAERLKGWRLGWCGRRGTRVEGICGQRRACCLEGRRG